MSIQVLGVFLASVFASFLSCNEQASAEKCEASWKKKVFLDENSDYDPDVDDSASIGSDTSSVSVQQGVQHLSTETSVCG